MNRAGLRQLGVITALLLFAALLAAGTAHEVSAQIPKYISFQGRLTDADDNPLSGDYQVTFRLYDAATSGNKQWEEVQDVSVVRGIFSCLLGSVSDFASVDFNDSYWLSVEIGDDGEMEPRQRVTSVAYAINADRIDSLDSSQLLRSDTADTMAGTLTFSGVTTDISTAANEDLIIDPAGTGNVVVNINSASDGFRVISDSLTTYFLVSDDGTVTARTIKPQTDATYDLGSSALKWKNLYVETIHADSVAGGSAITHSLDDAYDDGATVTVDEDDLVWNLAASSDFIIQDEGTAVVTVDDSGDVTIAGSLDMGGDLSVEGDFDVNIDKFIVEAATGDTQIAGTLDVTGETTLSDAVGITYTGVDSALTVTQGATGASATFAGGYVRVGQAGTVNNANGAGDLYVQDDLEVDGTLYASAIAAGTTITHSLDDAYEDGSAITVDAGDLVINLSTTNDFLIQDAGATAFAVNDAGTAQTRHVVPLADSAYDLGTDAVRYRAIYADTVTADSLIGSLQVEHSLDDAYDDGSTVTVDTSDVVWDLTSTNDFIVADDGSAVFTVDDTGDIAMTGDASIDGALSVGATLDVVGNFAVNTDTFTVAAVSGNTAVTGTLDVAGATSLATTLDVTGATTLADILTTQDKVDVDLGEAGEIVDIDKAAAITANLNESDLTVSAALSVADGGAYTAQGAVVTIENLADTETSGSITNTRTALVVNQEEAGSIVDFQDGGASRFRIADGGAITLGSTANNLALDEAGDLSLAGTADTLNLANTATRLNLIGGEVYIGSGTVDHVAGEGELYVAGDVEVDGTLYAASIDSGVAIDHSLDDAYDDGSTVTVDSTDVVWNLTSTNDFVIQSDGTAVLTVDENGNAIHNTGADGYVTIVEDISQLGGGAGADSDATLNLGIKDGVHEYIKWDNSVAGNGAFVFSDGITIRGNSPAQITFDDPSGDTKTLSYDASAGSDGSGAFVFGDQAIIPGESPAYLNFGLDTSTPKDGVYDEFYAIKMDPDPDSNAATDIQTFSVVTIPDYGTAAWQTTEQPLFDISSDGSFNIYNPNTGEAIFEIEKGGIFKHVFHNHVKNASFEAFSKLEEFHAFDPNFDTGTQGDYFQGGWDNFAPDEWLWVSGDTYQFAPLIFDPDYVPDTTTYRTGVYEGKSSLEIADIDLENDDTCPLTDIDAVFYDGQIRQKIKGLKPNSYYAVGVAMMAVDTGAIGILDISGEDSSAPFTPLVTVDDSLTSNVNERYIFQYYQGVFKTDEVGSDVRIHLIARDGAARFDAIQVVAGKIVPEYSPTSIVDTGDQTIYGALRLGRSADGRGGILAVDKYVRTRGIDFFSEDPGFTGTAGGGATIMPPGPPYRSDTEAPGYTILEVYGQYVESITRDYELRLVDSVGSVTNYAGTPVAYQYRSRTMLDPVQGVFSDWSSWITSGSIVEGTEAILEAGIKIKFSNLSHGHPGDTWYFSACGMSPDQQNYDSYNPNASYTHGEARIYKDPVTGELTFMDSMAGVVRLKDLIDMGAGAYIAPPVPNPNNSHTTSGAPTMVLTVSGSYVFTDERHYEIAIDFANGTNPTKFNWSDGVYSGTNEYWDGMGIEIPISGEYALGASGIMVQFNDRFGGVAGDRWTFSAFPGNVDDLPQHGHSGPNDGGMLTAPGTNANFFTIDHNNDAPGDIGLNFGDFSQSIKWNPVMNRFEINRNVDIAGSLTAQSLSGSTSTSGTTNATFAVDTDNTTGVEPADGAGFIITGGTGNVGITFDATAKTLKVTGPLQGMDIPAGATYRIGGVNFSFNDITGNLPASRVTAGTFDTGDFIFPDNLTVQDNLAVGADLTVDTGTLYVDSADDRVGIGTTNPGSALDVSGTIVGTKFKSTNATSVAGNNAVAFGRETIASGLSSIATGQWTTASGESSTAMGENTVASAWYSTALGGYSTASATGSTAIGAFTSSGGTYSMTLGRGVGNTQRLANNIGSSLMVGFNSTVPTLFVGPSSGAGTTGNVGIGTTDPGAKLDVSGGSIRTNNQLISTVTTGTAPLAVTSTTKVDNLNVESVDGFHASATPT
ncbi:MAG: hypothetical protein JW844_04520, partial [Candidatus Omnitrophica bacterium]|nr:hypothetical protein [Candidatus Omnitrophota bacterium]